MNEDELLTVLQQHFGFNQFRVGQAEILQALMQGQSTVALLPTGGGKSLIYQMMGVLRPGLIVIVTPLLSLMQDQVARLNYLGEKRVVALNSMLSSTERAQVLQALPQYHFLFISPEMLGNQDVLQRLRQCQLNLLVVDEAHTVLSWGLDFRPDYLKLPGIVAQLGQPQLLLLTATATAQMLTAMMQIFKLPIDQTYLYRSSVDRPNIYLHTENLSDEDAKRDRLKALVQTMVGPGIVYFSSRRLASQMALWLQQVTGLRVVAYHAGLDAQDRYRIQRQFMLDQIDVITATSAFGMGLDKADIRYVIHYQMSADIENYLQEFGRAGRDGKTAIAVLLYSPGDEQLQRSMIDLDLPDANEVRNLSQTSEQLPGISESAYRLVQYYAQKSLSIDDINQKFELRRKQRNQALNALLEYTQLTSGLRAYLLRYFADDSKIDATFENAQGDVDFKRLNLKREQAMTTKDTNSMDWQQKIEQLFNIR
ncbi:hypothetical protein IV73_GL000288 [Weissella kandleri]|uniref:ATP-dependent DNA helicase RecQ n=1 Tax=Weissella kandleri TaxID=1616 RepID=A0A0R2JP24_9LACO|nr:RecQ family ATP-dependent DNA helicase [Weissella kandleri]KRN75789.1 hypothetical protein IV73_GL000288 [Weissella kandleri]